MSRTKGWTLVWAVALAVGLWQFAFLSFVPPHRATVLDYVLPWLSRLTISAPIIALGIVVGCLTRPQRPERRAVLIGALAALPNVLPLVFSAETFKNLLIVLLGGESCETTKARLGFSQQWMVEHLFLILFMSLSGGATAAVASWLGANYWRCGNWTQFWKGPGGAILKGGLVAGLVAVAVGFVRWYGPVAEAFKSEALAIGVTLPRVPVWHIIIGRLGRICWYAMITALLVSWRPTKLIGAFAGSGISLGLFGVSMAYNAWMNRTTGNPMPSFVSMLSILSILFAQAMPGAIAGSFAGRWRDEPIE